MSVPNRTLTIVVVTEPTDDKLLDQIAEDVIYHLSAFWAQGSSGSQPGVVSVNALGDSLCSPPVQRVWHAPAS